MNSTEQIAANEQNALHIQTLLETDGTLGSPIDLDIARMNVIELDPLKWIGMDVPPRKLKVTNTGFTVIVSAKWQDERPCLTGGPFQGRYIFGQIHFHWGKNEMNGSDHTIDGASMPMEIHVVHFKEEYETLESALKRPNGVIVLVYFCKLQNESNPFMEEIVKNLPTIRTAHSSIRINPFKLTDLLPAFSADYFLYWGAITTTQNVHSILWIICREPIGISIMQLAEFRTMKDEKGVPILTNIRPLKGKHQRSVFHVCPSGSTYASLLPIPRDTQSIHTVKSTDSNETQ
ncbi:PREDICTED: carbonic anhydrase 1-like [Eufriesea mexicana]|uniref:carbonic anhydrase 1-like n=1 Tax=Eufriesea mexicana TaxID=516756 RepID=UPI00083C2970|nr:PREDICTED: carbonic anhydrase 1-like [Eufriesea mexicana]